MEVEVLPGALARFRGTAPRRPRSQSRYPQAMVPSCLSVPACVRRIAAGHRDGVSGTRSRWRAFEAASGGAPAGLDIAATLE